VPKPEAAPHQQDAKHQDGHISNDIGTLPYKHSEGFHHQDSYATSPQQQADDIPVQASMQPPSKKQQHQAGRTKDSSRKEETSEHACHRDGDENGSYKQKHSARCSSHCLSLTHEREAWNGVKSEAASRSLLHQVLPSPPPNLSSQVPVGLAAICLFIDVGSRHGSFSIKASHQLGSPLLHLVLPGEAGGIELSSHPKEHNHSKEAKEGPQEGMLPPAHDLPSVGLSECSSDCWASSSGPCWVLENGRRE
jgi:hypothetical protein